MRSLIITVAAALIFAASSAFAAPDHKDGDHGRPAGGSHGDGHAAQGQTSPSHVTHTGGMSGGMHGGMSGGMNGGMHGTAMQSHGTTNTTASHGAVFNAPTGGNSHNRNATRNYGNNGNNNYSNNNNRNYNNNSNRGGGRANFNRRNVTAQHHYHYRGGDYRGPSGYNYRRWAYGEMLPSIYWGRDYWIDDYYDYGLADPPPGCVWVRYGNDAVLIDEDSGEILEVVYDQFY